MKLLVLLIGHNNIANYALISYFSHNSDFCFDKVALVYTNSTFENAQNIINLKSNINFIEINLKEEGRNLINIEKIVFNFLKNIKINFIHLNYTGGTKPMALGVFLAINKLNVEKRFSDISPQNYKLTFANGETYPSKSSIIENVSITLDEYAKLNSFDIVSKKTNNSEFFNEEFCEFLLDKELNNDIKFFDFWNLKRNNQEILLDNFNTTLNISFRLDENNIDELKRFINGIWLENFIFDKLVKWKKELNIADVAWNVEIKGKRKFELDIVVSKGYKLYVFSCTVDKYELLKVKSFEAIYRTNQIGGINAKPILVSLAKNRHLKQLNEDLKETMGRETIDFIGREEIKDENRLKQKLKEIF